MQETSVGFEVAKLAKEKRFPVLNRGYGYTEKGEIADPMFGRIICEAPSQTLVQKWLRNVHKVIVTIDFYNNGEEWEDTEFIVTVDEFKNFTTHSSFVKEGFTNWEEALEIGLQEALKLI